MEDSNEQHQPGAPGALADAQRRLDAALSGGQITTWVWELESDRIYADRNYVDFYRLPPDGGKGLPVATYAATLHPDDIPVVMAALERSIETGENYEAEYRIVTFDPPRWAYSRATVERNAAGKAVRLAGVVLDITARKNAEATQRASDAQYRALFDSVDQGVCIIEMIFDAAGRAVDYAFIETNPAFEHQSGLSNAVGRRMREIAPDHEPFWFDLYGKVATSGEAIRIEHEATALGRQFEVHATRVEGTAKNRVAVIFDDVTKKRLALQRVQESEERFRRLADAMPQIVWAARPDGTVDYYNRRWYEYTGMPTDDIGRASWQGVHHPADLERLSAEWDLSVASGNPFDTQQLYRRANDGAYRWHLVRAEPVRDASGAVTRWFGTSTDVHDRKSADDALNESRQQMTVAVEAGRLGTWQVDLATMEMNCSEMCKANFGRPLTEAFTYAALWDVIHPDDRDRAQLKVRRAIEARTDYATEYRVVWPDGSIHWVAVRGRVTYAPDGSPLKIAGVSQDITDRKSMEAEREQIYAAERAARIESEQAGRMKDEFLATLSHELRTPLSAIVGWTQILKSTGTHTADVAEGLDVIDRNARAQTQIIEDILDMSRIISGKLRLDVQNVDLASLVQAGVDTVQPAADAKGVRLMVMLDPAAGPVSGDPNRLHQLFWNLMSNAVKFTPRGGRVQVRLERVNSHVEVSVADTGEGIAAAFLPHVFDRFRQADASTTRRHGGLGLGLAIVKQLVELHGGSVAVRSAGVGQGATFIVMIPLNIAYPQTIEPSSPREHPGAAIPLAALESACEQLSGVSILVVDDEADASAMVKRLLQDCGAEVRTARSAAQAISMFDERVPHILVSDIGMPGEDGYTLIRRVRARPASAGGNVHALAVTAYARAADRVKALEAGFQMHLSKPVEPVELIVTVAALAKLSRVE